MIKERASRRGSQARTVAWHVCHVKWPPVAQTSRSLRCVPLNATPGPRALYRCASIPYTTTGRGKARGKLGDRGQVTGNRGEGIDDWRLMNAEW